MADTWAPYLITGVRHPFPTSESHREPPLRRDICDLWGKEEHKHEFTLFILALNKIMHPDYKHGASSFQGIAGIHGMPYTPWAGDPDEARQTDRGLFLGYCNHGSILFPTWHRPQLMLLEQSISDAAIGIAGEFAFQDAKEEHREWLTAAAELRLPFWDWTHPRTGEKGIPEFFKNPTIEIYMPNGSKEGHKNPLYSYEFIKEVDGFDNRYAPADRIYKKDGTAYYKEWKRTYRNPDSRPSRVTEDYADIDARLTSKKREPRHGDQKLDWQEGSWIYLTRSVSQLFAFPIQVEKELYANVWDEFSNTTVQSAPSRDKNDKPLRRWPCATSLESPHNTVHVLVGGIGHMSDNDTAGFDPIFYLHHCNIDRLLSFWQHIYPDYGAGTTGYYVGPNQDRKEFTQPYGTWMQLDGQTLNEESALLPFRNADYKYWTSKDAYSLKYKDEATANKSYTYPPIVINEQTSIEINTDPEKEIAIEEREKQRRYLQDYFGYDPRRARDAAPRVPHRIFKAEAPYRRELNQALDPKREPVDNFRQFFINVSLDPTLLPRSYSAVISFKMPTPLGSKPTIEIEQITEPAIEIGEVTVLSRGRSDLCGNCKGKRAAGARVHGTVLVPHELVAWALFSALPVQEDKKIPDDDDEVIKVIWSCLGASLRLPDGKTYAKLTNLNELNVQSTSGSHMPEPPHIELLSCDVYLQRRTDRPLEGQKDTEPDTDSLHEIPYDFDDWVVHGSLAHFPQATGPASDEPGQDGTFKRKWVLH